MNKLNTVKSILWALVSIGVVLAISRFFDGIGRDDELKRRHSMGLVDCLRCDGGCGPGGGGLC